MTAIAERTDLLWVTFTEDDGDEPCDGYDDVPCPLEPVVVAWFEHQCACPERLLRCAPHRDRMLADARVCKGLFRCREHHTASRLLRLEPLR